MLLPRVIAFYRSLRTPNNNNNIALQPASPEASRALNLVFASSVVSLILTLPFFTPSNVFRQTSSRLQTPTPVLFNRLSTITPQDELLRDIFTAGGLEARLQYLRFGPDVLSNCPLVTDPKAHDAPSNYLICALPSLLKPHLAHLFFLGLATSSFVGGTSAARWRTPAILSAILVALANILSVATYEHHRNALAFSASAIQNFFWTRHLLSHLAISLVSAILALLIWASATNRAFVLPPSPAAQLEAQTRLFETSLAKYRALGAVRNVVMREAGLREKLNAYWRKEGELMHEVFEERDVLEAVNGVLGRMDVGALGKEADLHVERVLGPAGE
jgi:hypothetical protein